MIPREAEFRNYYVESGGSENSARSYLTYLRRVDRACGGIDERLKTATMSALIDWVDRQPDAAFAGRKNASDSRSALRKLAAFLADSPASPGATGPTIAPRSTIDQQEVMSLLRAAKRLGAEYYRKTGKPLGVTGEVAELEAAEKLGLTLCDARTPGFDAIDPTREGRRIQIKGRAVSPVDRYRGRCPSIKCGGRFDDVLLVLLDKESLDAIEIWQASEERVAERLSAPGSKSRNERNSMGISQFRSIATLVWAK